MNKRIFLIDSLQTDDVRRESVTLIPCEFCNVQQPGENLDRHQVELFYHLSVFY